MPRVPIRLVLFSFAALPFLAAFAQQGTENTQEPTCEQVFKNIQVFKGVPASDLIPAMEFMAASLKYECADCHNPQDYSADNRTKEAARHMILMQRDINTKNFNGRTEVTCMTCHRGSEHPVGTPIPDGVALRHKRMENPPKPADLFASYLTAVGKETAPLVRKGTLTAPNDVTHKVETKPLEFIQAPGGKFLLVAGDRKIGSNGSQTWYGPMQMSGEPAAVFDRIGRAWRTQDLFDALTKPTVSGQDVIGKANVIAVRAAREATTSTEELSFDTKTNLLLRLVNVRRSTLGNVVSIVDYSNYRTIDGIKTPMKVVATFAGGQQWILDFKSAKLDPTIKDDTFNLGNK